MVYSIFICQPPASLIETRVSAALAWRTAIRSHATQFFQESVLPWKGLVFVSFLTFFSCFLLFYRLFVCSNHIHRGSSNIIWHLVDALCDRKVRNTNIELRNKPTCSQPSQAKFGQFLFSEKGSLLQYLIYAYCIMPGAMALSTEGRTFEPS